MTDHVSSNEQEEDDRRQRLWERALARAARRDRAIAEAQTRQIDAEEYARLVRLGEEAMAFVLRMAEGEI